MSTTIAQPRCSGAEADVHVYVPSLNDIHGPDDILVNLQTAGRELVFEFGPSWSEEERVWFAHEVAHFIAASADAARAERRVEYVMAVAQ